MSRYENTNIIRNKIRGKNKNIKTSLTYATTTYSNIPERNDDFFVIATEGDRCDNLAFQYYGDSRLWWYIAQANNLNTMNIPEGTELRIPSSTEYSIGG